MFGRQKMAAEHLEEQYKDLQKGNDRYKQLISQDNDILLHLDQKKTVIESRIQEKLAVPGGIVKHKGKHNRHRKQIRILENELNQETLMYDEIQGSNLDRLEEISYLMEHREELCSTEEKYNRQLASQQRTVEELGKKSTQAQTQRSETQTQMSELEVRDDVEVKTKRKMLATMKKVTVHDSKLHKFLEKKSKEIIPLKDDDNSKKRKKLQQYQSGVERLEMYMQGHATLVEVTGEPELCQIGQSFIENEQMSPALVNYINKLHNRRSTLKNSTGVIKSNILLLEQENDGRDQQSEARLMDLESELEKRSCLADSLEKRCALVQETLDQIKMAVAGLVSDITQTAAVVTDDNVVHFTSILEDSVTELLVQAIDVGDEDTDLPPQNLLLANSNLLPEGVEDTQHSVKSA